MELEAAVNKSPVKAAYRPYYSEAMKPLRDKFIVCRMLSDFYVVWADTFDYISDLYPPDYWKVQNRKDWTPVGVPLQEVVNGNTGTDASADNV